MAFQRDQFNGLHKLLRMERSNGNDEQRAIAENFLREERLSERREDSYGAKISASLDFLKWKRFHSNYLEEKILFRVTKKTPKPETPETFTETNKNNLLDWIDEDLYLVRVENLSDQQKHLSGTGVTEVHLVEFFKSFISDKKHQNIIKSFLYKWNESRDLRPCFAGFWEEVKDLFVDSSGNERENPTWANELRDRFGLAQLNPGVGKPIPVLLLRYPAKDIFATVGKDKDKAFAAPTVLDTGLWEYFCPSPAKMDCGRIVNISCGSTACSTPHREILHQHINWQPEHMYRVGLINEKLSVVLKHAREQHLNMLSA